MVRWNTGTVIANRADPWPAVHRTGGKAKGRASTHLLELLDILELGLLLIHALLAVPCVPK
jgi:hypothetical protein